MLWAVLCFGVGVFGLVCVRVGLSMGSSVFGGVQLLVGFESLCLDWPVLGLWPLSGMWRVGLSLD